MINCNSANIVYPRLLESRDGNGELVLNIRKGLTLYLEKSTVLADNFYLDSSTTAGTQRTVLKGPEIEANLYHDKKHQSSLIVTRSNNGIEVHGILNHEFTITPAVVHERSRNGTVAHNVSPIEKMSRVGDDEGNGTVTRRRSPRMFPVELWLLVSSEYRAAFTTCEYFLTYLAITVNAVALRFINMTNPKIRFQLNGVTIDYNDSLTKREVCSVHIKGVKRPLRKAFCGIDAQDTLKRTIFFTRAKNIDADLVYLITRKNLVWNISNNSTTVLEDILGMAYVGGVCTLAKAGVGEDKPRTYSGVPAMAHEIAHLLGSLHDGEAPQQNMEGHLGGAKCSRSDGYLMGDWNDTPNEYRLSECTKKQIQYHSRRLSLKCIKLRKKAKRKNNYYPGQLLKYQEYCRALYPDATEVWPTNKGGNSYKKCIVFCCSRYDYEDYDYNPTECKPHRMLEAMPCGVKKTCRRGVCGAHNWTDIYKTWRAF
ncbi:hypothetical protein MTO96_024355 [Rhipicephalus appendiculatus]